MQASRPARVVTPNDSQVSGDNLKVKFIMDTVKKSEERSSKNKSYKVLVDGNKFEFNKSVVTGEEILIKIGKTPPECHTLYQKLKGCEFEKISISLLFFNFHIFL